jgi:hypothetical protein
MHKDKYCWRKFRGCNTGREKHSRKRKEKVCFEVLVEAKLVGIMVTGGNFKLETCSDLNLNEL